MLFCSRALGLWFLLTDNSRIRKHVFAPVSLSLTVPRHPSENGNTCGRRGVVRSKARQQRSVVRTVHRNRNLCNRARRKPRQPRDIVRRRAVRRRPRQQPRPVGVDIRQRDLCNRDRRRFHRPRRGGRSRARHPLRAARKQPRHQPRPIALHSTLNNPNTRIESRNQIVNSNNL